MPSMSRSARGIESLVTATRRVEQLEEELERARAEVRRLEEVELPQAFTEDGVSALTSIDGQRAERHLSVQGSFPSPTAERPDAVARFTRARDWMIENGYEDNIRAVVTANYGTGDRARALAEYERLRGDNRAAVAITETVHHSTLRGLVRQRVENGLPTPVEDLGCTIIRRVRLANRRSASAPARTQMGIEPEDL